MKLSKIDEIELSRILEDVNGRLDPDLIKLIIDLIFKTKVSSKKEDNFLFSSNLEKIPNNSIDSFMVGSVFGQSYQIGLDLAKRMDLKLDRTQKRILRELTFFLVLSKFEKELKLK